LKKEDEPTSDYYDRCYADLKEKASTPPLEYLFHHIKKVLGSIKVNPEMLEEQADCLRGKLDDKKKLLGNLYKAGL